MNILKAVAAAGCDAVYFGGEKFGARANAANFTSQEAEEGIDYLHIHGKKAYLTVNTLVKNKEAAKELYEFILPLYLAGLDAVIVQDFGVMQFLREQFPQLHIHISTQMSVSNVCGARFLKDHGADRIVTARELSLAEIKQIQKEAKIEIESFVHGALCFSYSGQCLMSSLIGQRSANRGRCAQPCRLPYDVYDSSGRGLNEKEKNYPLSLKDLCTIDLLPDMLESGITSFKIEGRMKQVDYAAGVVGIYRDYLDRYEAHGRAGYQVEARDRELLLGYGNRSGFTDGYYKKRNGSSMVTWVAPNHRHENQESVSIPELKRAVNIEILAQSGKELLFTISSEANHVIKTGPVLGIAEKRPTSEEVIKEKVTKLGNTVFYCEELRILNDPNVFVPMTALNELRREAVLELSSQILSTFRREKTDRILVNEHIKEDFMKQIQESTVLSENAVSNLKGFSVTIEELAQWKPLLVYPWIDIIYLDISFLNTDCSYTHLYDKKTEAERTGKKIGLAMPHVFRNESEKEFETLLGMSLFEYYLVRTQDELQFLLSRGIGPDHIRLDHSVYTWSDMSRFYYFKATGILQDTVPMELNKKEIAHRFNLGSEMLIYGHVPLMTTAQCLHKNTQACDLQEETITIKDRYQIRFPVKNHCRVCYNTVYNSIPLCLTDVLDDIISMEIKQFRISFTIETAEQTKAVLTLIDETIRHLKDTNKERTASSVLGEFTFGHWKRGVD